MNFIIPVLSSFLTASSRTFDKAVLNFRGISSKIYNAISFPFYALFSFILMILFSMKFNPLIVNEEYFFFFAISIFFLAFTNLVFYRALKKNKLTEIEMISLMGYLPLIILSGIIFTDERNYKIILFSLIAVIVLIWGHWEKHHIKLAKNTEYFLYWMILIIPINGILSKKLLEVWDPLQLLFARDLIISLIFIPLFLRHFRGMEKKAWIYTALGAFIGTFGAFLYYYSYQISGIVLTVLVFSLAPLFVYLMSYVFLKEKFDLKKFIAFIMILVCIVLSRVL